MAFYIFPRAIPKKECKSLLKYCLKNSKFMDASTLKKGFSEVHIDGTEKDSDKESIYNYEMRKTDVSWITDKENRVNELVWGFIREANKLYFNYKLDYFQAIQFARYKNGGHYDWHRDLQENLISANGVMRKLSLTFCLSDPNKYEGGELQFYNGERPRLGYTLSDGTEITAEQIKEDMEIASKEQKIELEKQVENLKKILAKHSKT